MDPIYQCLKCATSMKNRKKAISHFLLEHVGKDQIKYSCLLCGFRSVSRSKFLKHVKGFKLHLKRKAEQPSVQDDSFFKISDKPYTVKFGHSGSSDILIISQSKEKKEKENADILDLVNDECEKETLGNFGNVFSKKKEENLWKDEKRKAEEKVKMMTEEIEMMRKEKRRSEENALKFKQSQEEIVKLKEKLERENRELGKYVERLERKMDNMKKGIESTKRVILEEEPVVGVRNAYALDGFQELWGADDESVCKKVKSVIVQSKSKEEMWREFCKQACHNYTGSHRIP